MSEHKSREAGTALDTRASKHTLKYTDTHMHAHAPAYAYAHSHACMYMLSHMHTQTHGVFARLVVGWCWTDGQRVMSLVSS